VPDKIIRWWIIEKTGTLGSMLDDDRIIIDINGVAATVPISVQWAVGRVKVPGRIADWRPMALWMTLIPCQHCHLITILFIVLKMRKSVQTVSFSMRKTTFKHPLSIDPRELGCSNTVSMVFRPTSRMEFFRQFQVSFPMSVTYMKMRMSDGSEALRKQR
jgi:hypothetical protein